jgi:conserved hypothetical protein
VGIAVALLWALFFFGYVRVENLAGLKSQPGAVCLAALLAWLTIPVGAYRWHLLLKSQEIELPGSKVLWLTWFGIFANNYMPATLGTDFSRAVYLFRAFPDRKSAVLVSIVLDRLAALGGILSALALFSLDLLVTQDIPSWVLMLTFCAYGVLVLSALAWLYFRYRPAHHSVAVWLEARLGHTRFGKPFCQLVALLKNCKDSPGTIAKAFFLSLVNTLLMILAFYVLTQAAGFSVVSLLTVGFAAPLSLIVNMLPFSPGGLGIGEVGFAHIAMILMPHAQLEGTGVVFLAYRLVVLVTSLPGLLLLLGGRTLKAVPGSSARAEGAAK